MGEVYRARDTRLDRSVALKLLSTHYNDPARVSRFRQEAKAASALSHPNIVTIYEIGQADRSWYISQELVEGLTLRDRMSAGKLSSEQAVAIAVQCCAALGASHQARVIHRDIKPENIILRPDGAVKIVDFGLARITEPTSGAVQATQTGAVMGTPRYMSPEQARGEKLDPRTDVFSLGAVLYEMIAGRPAFPGASTAEVFAALLSVEPPPETGTACDAVIRRALAKERAARFPDMEQFAAELRAIDPAARTRRRWKLPVGAIIGVAAALAVAFGAVQWRSRQSLTIEAPRFVALTTFGGLKDFPALSPDGSRIAFSWRPPGETSMHIYVKSTGNGEPVQLTSAAIDDVAPAWSADGSQIAFCRRDGTGIDVDLRSRTPAAVHIAPPQAAPNDASAMLGWACPGPLTQNGSPWLAFRTKLRPAGASSSCASKRASGAACPRPGKIDSPYFRPTEPGSRSLGSVPAGDWSFTSSRAPVAPRSSSPMMA
jgi:hypothetical protein